MPECDRKGRWFRGCRWEAQYDSQRPVRGAEMSWSTTTGPSQDVLEMFVDRETYVGALCLTCGAYTSRQEEQHAPDQG
jgi:hypothetical protein